MANLTLLRHRFRGQILLLITAMIFSVNQVFSQDVSIEEKDDRPLILKNFQGSEEEYKKIKKEYYEANGLIESSGDTWSAVSEPLKIDCHIKFEVPTSLNQPQKFFGTWQIESVSRIGNKDFEKESGDPTLIDLHRNNKLILSTDKGTFSDFSEYESYWDLENENTITLYSFHKDACFIERLEISVVSQREDDLTLKFPDPDKEEGVFYKVKFKSTEK